jgi:WD40 repeat protein
MKPKSWELGLVLTVPKWFLIQRILLPRVWDVKTGEQLAKLSGHQETVLWAEFSPDGKWIVTSSGDNTARVWDAASGVGITVMKGHADKVYQARFSPDSLRVVTASKDGSVCLWDAASLNSTVESFGGA